ALLAYGGLILTGVLLGYDESILRLLPLAGLSLFVDLLGNMVHNQLLAREQMIIPSIISVAHIFILIGLVALALLGGMGLPGLYIATIGAGALRALAYWVALARSGVRTVWPLDWQVALGLVINGAPLMVNSFLGTAYQHVDKIVMTATIGQENTAYLLVAFLIVAGMVELLSTTVLVAVFPMMSRQYGAGEHEAFAFLVQKIAFLTLVITVPIAVMVSVWAATLVTLLFSAEYTRTIEIVQVLIWYGVVTMVANVFAQVLMIQNRQTRLLGIRAAGLTLNVILLLALLPRIGPVGAAVGSLLAEFLVVGLLIRQWERRAALLRDVGPRVLRLGLVGAGLAAGMLLVRAAGGVATGAAAVVLAALAGIAGLAVYGAAVWFGGVIAPDDRGFIRQVLVSMPGGGAVARVWKGP
ncbi:MAG: polysaccharide biosynthesis C-terminal domain-containing protein, partial [Anaerolineae bacterium]|nr:polysaccharide biosynthesis C-terminal domain-containing protein [Anaerolineae bacterium]